MQLQNVSTSPSRSGAQREREKAIYLGWKNEAELNFEPLES